MPWYGWVIFAAMAVLLVPVVVYAAAYFYKRKWDKSVPIVGPYF